MQMRGLWAAWRAPDAREALLSEGFAHGVVHQAVAVGTHVVRALQTHAGVALTHLCGRMREEGLGKQDKGGESENGVGSD